MTAKHIASLSFNLAKEKYQVESGKAAVYMGMHDFINDIPWDESRIFFPSKSLFYKKKKKDC